MANCCDLCGIQIRYPENWTVSGPIETDEDISVLIESPAGMFLSVHRYPTHVDHARLLHDAIKTMETEYEEIEREPYQSIDSLPTEKGVNLQFFCDQYIITSRLIAIRCEGETLLIQIQAESRDFDENELVFDAMVKGIRDHLRNR